MGLSVSKQNKKTFQKPGAEYERALSELAAQISMDELALSEARVTERKVSVYHFFYSLLFTFCLFAFLFLTRSPGSKRSVLIDLLLIFGVPFVLYYVNRGISYWFRRKINNLESALQTLRAKQKLKLEELKDSTAYYQTRGLIERFDPEFRKDSTVSLLHHPKEPSIQPIPLEKHIEIASNPIRDNMAFVIPPEPKKTWMDRMVDAMIGDDSRHSKYALICQKCHAHNGLALPDEVLSLGTQFDD
jgi:hypothetical protein